MPVYCVFSTFDICVFSGCGGGDTDKADGDAQQAGQGDGAGGTTGTGGGVADSGTSNPMTPPGENPVYEIRTNVGSFTVELMTSKAPQTCSTFERNAQSGRYDGTIFHEVYNVAIIGGGFKRDLSARPVSMAIVNEADNGLKNVRGTMSMLRKPENKDSATGDFFVNVTDNPNFDHQDDTDEGFGYCVFGTVKSGMDVVEAISKKPVKQQDGFASLPLETVEILEVKKIK